MDNINFNTAWIALTYACNNNCLWCYAASNDKVNAKKILPIKYKKGIVRLLSDLQIKQVTLIGGEPTIYTDLLEFIKSLADSNLHTGLVTNGRLLSNRRFVQDLKKSGLKSATFSIEGYDETSHDSVTQVKGSFKEALEGLENALYEGLSVTSNTVISTSNSKSLEKIVDLLGDKVRSMSFNICGPCVSKEENNSSILPITESISSFERIFNYADSRGVKTNLVTPVPLCLFDSNHLEKFKKQRIAYGGPCQMAHGNNFVIDYNGDILPCTHLTGFPLLNIFENEDVISSRKFKEIYLSSEGIPAQFRKQMRRYPSKKCENTTCNEKCSGGCPLLWMKFNPEEEIKGIIP